MTPEEILIPLILIAGLAIAAIVSIIATMGNKIRSQREVIARQDKRRDEDYQWRRAAESTLSDNGLVLIGEELLETHAYGVREGAVISRIKQRAAEAGGERAADEIVRGLNLKPYMGKRTTRGKLLLDDIRAEAERVGRSNESLDRMRRLSGLRRA